VADPVFNLEQLSLLRQCLVRSEGLVARAFRIPALPSGQYPYEVATLVDLAAIERAAEAFAHLVIYERARPSGPEPLYRICLQDDSILARLGDGGPEWPSALLVYILTHELTHVVRFQRAEHPIQAEAEAREREEDEVHRRTMHILRAGRATQLARLEELYGNPVIPARTVHTDENDS
jgi:hypothetical protein